MATPSMDMLSWLRKQLEEADVDLLREMVSAFVATLMGSEADAICGATYGERSPERVNSRNGYRPRSWDTRAGTIELAIPKLRTGSYFPEWFRASAPGRARSHSGGGRLLPRRGLDSTGRQAGQDAGDRAPRQVPGLRARQEPRRDRRALQEPPPRLRALCLPVARRAGGQCRENGRIVNVCCVIATGVNSDGHREVLGVDIVTAEDGAAWTAFLRGLKARGLSEVKLVLSDSHAGLTDAIATVLDGAAWQLAARTSRATC
jgi:putative transposase